MLMNSLKILRREEFMIKLGEWILRSISNNKALGMEEEVSVAFLEEDSDSQEGDSVESIWKTCLEGSLEEGFKSQDSKGERVVGKEDSDRELLTLSAMGVNKAAVLILICESILICLNNLWT